VQLAWIGEFLDSTRALGVPLYAVTHHEYIEVCLTQSSRMVQLSVDNHERARARVCVCARARVCVYVRAYVRARLCVCVFVSMLVWMVGACASSRGRGRRRAVM
jgi:hypothetical protein